LNPMSKVLLVENNQIFREAFKLNLQQYFPSLVIEEVPDGEKALKKIQTGPPALVFTDMSLPGMNGFQLIQKIKKSFPKIAVVLMTGHDLPEYREAALQYGADSFFDKGDLKWKEVKTLIEKILRASGKSSSGRQR
jgi:DNA-binding NarL/FixJ family response regulator